MFVPLLLGHAPQYYCLCYCSISGPSQCPAWPCTKLKQKLAMQVEGNKISMGIGKEELIRLLGDYPVHIADLHVLEVSRVSLLLLLFQVPLTVWLF